MSLYGMVFGRDQRAPAVLAVLGTSRDQYGRFRDAYPQGDYLVVHTRCGGGNREDYWHVFAWAEAHPLYSHNEDSDYDFTYANIYYRKPKRGEYTLPATLVEAAGGDEAAWEWVDRLLNSHDAPTDTERWDAVLEAIRTAPSPAAKEAAG